MAMPVMLRAAADVRAAAVRRICMVLLLWCGPWGARCAGEDVRFVPS
jgi:hypothetical protein